MNSYPRGARLLFWLSRRTGVGVQQLYDVTPLRWLITLLDSLDGNPPT